MVVTQPSVSLLLPLEKRILRCEGDAFTCCQRDELAQKQSAGPLSSARRHRKESDETQGAPKRSQAALELPSVLFTSTLRY